MKVKNIALRAVVTVKNPILKFLRRSRYWRLLEEALRWSFTRLPLGFTLPLATITLTYFVVIYPVLVYHFVPWLLALPARWAHRLFDFGAVSKMGCDWALAGRLGCTGAQATGVYHQLLDIVSALLTLSVALGGVIAGYGFACFCYRSWRALSLKRRPTPTCPPRVALRKAEAADGGVGVNGDAAHNPLERFERIGIILAGGGAKGAYQAGAMKAIYEFLEEHNAHDRVKMMAGTSIGSWNALFWLADMVKDAGVDAEGRRIPGALESWWRGVSISEIIKPVKYLPTRQNFLLSNEPWQDTFKHLFGPDTEGGRRLLEHMEAPDQDDNVNFYFTCTNIEQARLEVTTNDNERVTHPDPYLGGTNKLANMTARIARTLDELRFGVFSSMDLPPLFEYATGGNGNGDADFYEDGGVIDNLPIYFGTEVEECDLLFILPLNASFEQEVNHRSLIRRLARVTNIRQGVLERKAFKDIYLFNEMAYLRELACGQDATLRGLLNYLEGKRDVLPEATHWEAEIQKALVPVAPDGQSVEDISPLQRALRRRHKPVQVFSVCPAPKLKINTAQFWKTREAGEAFDLMYEATKLGLEHKLEWLLSRNFVTMVQVHDNGRRVFFDDF
ncbi:MAG: Patatin-like phospholipase [Acidobacteriota bacterium]|jgi:predicted acylesterase/phospholipase RssA|nr:Patatin-like phospholipase [Acidobacteriota bacterium]